VADVLFEDHELASLYDAFCGTESRDDFRFYLSLILRAQSVLDTGCGTGALLHLARERGHAGRLVGVDPAAGMLAVARTRSDVEWIHCEVASAPLPTGFDLAVMTGHAFQAIVEDEDIRATFAAVQRALRPGGVFAFETRNPSARGWEHWVPEHAVDEDGAAVTMTPVVESVEADRVTFRLEFSGERWSEPRISRSTLRFLGVAELRRMLEAAGFEVEAQYGHWDRSPVTATSPEIITLARRA
jgi:ubiquinone/menaquinone biosynthesis C-methylase UbiE